MARVEVAIAGIGKYATRERGDVADIVERPTGGMTVIVVDGQGSGTAAKALAMQVSARALSLVRDGVGDLTVAQAVADFLHSHRRGQVSATLDLVSIVPHRGEVTVTRHNPTPFVVCAASYCGPAGEGSDPIGPPRSPRVVTARYGVEQGFRMALYTDGVAGAGGPHGPRIDVAAWLGRQRDGETAERLATGLLDAAIVADGGRPRDDMTVVAVAVSREGRGDGTRLVTVSLPWEHS